MSALPMSPVLVPMPATFLRGVREGGLQSSWRNYSIEVYAKQVGLKSVSNGTHFQQSLWHPWHRRTPRVAFYEQPCNSMTSTGNHPHRRDFLQTTVGKHRLNPK